MLTRTRALEEALRKIAASYPWEPYEDDETIPGTEQPTNRRIAREALAAVDTEPAVQRATPDVAVSGASPDTLRAENKQLRGELDEMEGEMIAAQVDRDYVHAELAKAREALRTTTPTSGSPDTLREALREAEETARWIAWGTEEQAAEGLARLRRREALRAASLGPETVCECGHTSAQHPRFKSASCCTECACDFWLPVSPASTEEPT